jgi:hypothetical protein
MKKITFMVIILGIGCADGIPPLMDTYRTQGKDVMIIVIKGYT